MCTNYIHPWQWNIQRSAYCIPDIKQIKYQLVPLVPLDVHCCNAAEHAICTWKKHFIAGLSSTDPSFPMAGWDRLVKQAELTLNLLRNARVNPKLSSWAHLFGQFDFNSTPMAPPGTKIIIRSKPNTRASWDPRGLVGFYIIEAQQYHQTSSISQCHLIIKPL